MLSTSCERNESFALLGHICINRSGVNVPAACLEGAMNKLHQVWLSGVWLQF